MVIWCHGFYYRKPDRINHGNDSVNDIPIPRHQCADCRHTFSTLPEYIKVDPIVKTSQLKNKI